MSESYTKRNSDGSRSVYYPEAQKKYQEKLDQITYSEFKDFHLKNKYMLLPNSIEANMLKQNYPISK